MARILALARDETGLNESPSQKEGKLWKSPGDEMTTTSLNESPSQKEGK